MLNNNKHNQIRDAVLPLCVQAGAVILKHFNNRSQTPVHTKPDASPVTQADTDANAIITQGLQTLTWGWPIISEEAWPVEFSLRKSWPTYWLVDPLDGTKEFIEGSGSFTVNIALIHNHVAIWGAIYAPVSGKMYWGGKAYGAWKQDITPTAPFTPCYLPNSTRISAANTQLRMQNKQPLRLATSVRHGLPALQSFQDQLQPIYPNITLTPQGSSLKFCAIAEGNADIYPRFGATSEWDTAAGQAILEGAGGKVVNLQGKPLRYNHKSDIINPEFMAFGAEAGGLMQHLLRD